jgi:microcystin-dependent protein
MAQPYVGEIRIFAGNFPPNGWAFCDGQLLPISENEVLFQLIGTTYGGDGQSTFALPDLRGRVPIHQGNGFVLAENGGVEEVTLTTSQIPAHTHPMVASMDTGDTPNPVGAVVGVQNVMEVFSGDVPSNNMAANAISQAGGSQPHTNFQPYLCVNFILSLFGIFPSQT